MSYLDIKDFSNMISENVKKSGYNFNRSIYYYLNIAHGDDANEMLWHMLRILEVIQLKDEKVYELLANIQDDPFMIKKFFYAMIIGIMRSSLEQSESEIQTSDEVSNVE